MHQYLAHSMEGGVFVPPMFEGDPYPSGNEQRTINAKFAAVFREATATSGMLIRQGAEILAVVEELKAFFQHNNRICWRLFPSGDKLFIKS